MPTSPVPARIGWAALAVALLSLLWLGWSRREGREAVPPPLPEAALRPPGTAASPSTPAGKTPAVPLRAPDPAEAPAPRGARLRGRVILPTGARAAAYRLLVFDAAGEVEANQEFPDPAQFEVGPLPAGWTFILAVFPSGDFPAASASLELPAEGERSVDLTPPAGQILEGQVVRPSGQPAAGCLLTFKESLPAGQLPKGPLREGAGRITHLGGRAGGGVSRYFDLDLFSGTLTRSASTDDEGRFRLTLSTGGTPVEIQVLKSLGVPLKKEAVVPGNGPIRLLVPDP